MVRIFFFLWNIFLKKLLCIFYRSVFALYGFWFKNQIAHNFQLSYWIQYTISQWWFWSHLTYSNNRLYFRVPDINDEREPPRRNRDAEVPWPRPPPGGWDNDQQVPQYPPPQNGGGSNDDARVPQQRRGRGNRR